MIKLGLLGMSLLAALEGGCGGGAASNPDGADSRDFIAADVDGVRVLAELQPWAGTCGGNGTELSVAAGKTSRLDGWSLIVRNSVGTAACPPSWIGLFEINTPVVCSDGPAANCSITVTTAAPALGDVLEGTFTATLSPYGADPATARMAVVRNGAFHVTWNVP